MKKILFLMFFIFFTASLIKAQSNESIKQTEIFVGHSFINTNADQRLNGSNISMTSNINKYWGIKGDFGKYNSNRENTYTVMAGPSYAMRFKKFRTEPFAHALFGAISNHTTSFSMAYGGGLDVKINSAFAVRAFQADYLRFHGDSNYKSGVRFSFGVVLRLGSKNITRD